jgi:hypothetical protein
MYSPAEFTNDINPKMNAKNHMNAEEYIKTFDGHHIFDGCLFDPPYTYRQICETYDKYGIDRADFKNNNQVYAFIKDLLAPKLKAGGISIHCGYHSNGFGKGRGFKIEEILIVAHGGAHYDTIVTVERKMFRHLWEHFQNMKIPASHPGPVWTGD